MHPTTADDIAVAVKVARDHGVSVSVKSGGHSGVSFSNELVINMDGMSTVEVNAQAQPPTVTCGGGVRAGAIDAACMPHGLATTLGNVSCVGAAGLLMGGGTGFMARWQGLAIDNLITATVVLADGSIVEANDTESPDLFYGLKGGGGNFGVLVKFTLRCFKVTGTYSPAPAPNQPSEETIATSNDGGFIHHPPSAF